MLYQMTLYMSVTALIILLFKKVFKNKLSARFHVLIWLLLFVRMFSPLLPESKTSVFNTVNRAEISVSQNVGETVTVPTTETIPNSSESAAKSKSVTDIIYIVWLAGACIMLSHFVFVYADFSRKVSVLPQNCDAETAEIINNCKDVLNIRRNIRVCSGETPMLKGIFSPTVILPNDLSENEKRAAIMHEMCHLKHNDIILLWIAMLILTINWFNPIMWCSFFTFRKDIEVYCDKRTLNHIKNKKDYAHLLLKTALKHNRFVLGTTSLQNGEKEVSKRIKRIAHFKKPKAIWTVGAVLAAAIIACLCLTNTAGDYKLKDIPEYCNNMVGSIMADLDYADSEKVVFHYLNGFFVYNQKTENIDIAIDLSKLNIAPHQQGSFGLNVAVDNGGNHAYLSSFGPDDEIKGFKNYIINLSDGSVKRGSMPKNTELFDKLSDTYETVPNAKGWFSNLCVKTDNEFYYITDESENIGNLKLITSADEKYIFAKYYTESYNNENIDATPLFSRTAEELANEFKRVYTPYYDIKNLEIFNWSESGNEATFLYKMTYLNYVRDVNKVDYLNEAKGSANYEKLCEDYLSEHESNYEFKVELSGDENNPLSSVGVLKLYTNTDPHGVKWERVKVDDFVL